MFNSSLHFDILAGISLKEIIFKAGIYLTDNVEMIQVDDWLWNEKAITDSSLKILWRNKEKRWWKI